jgi:aminoglycoside phosphotransferase (APT) family kinase protein
MEQCLPVQKADITPELVSRLVATQFPQWADLPIRPVDVDGWDNATFRLGRHMSVRLPSSQAYVEQIDKEQRWLPVLARQLPLPIPEPLAKGKPGCGFPRPWSVYRWIDGQTAEAGQIADLCEFAAGLAGFLAALYGVDPSGGPLPGTHNFFRGGSPAYYDAETRAALTALHGHIDTSLATEVWEAALEAQWDGPPVWFHGDAQPGNLLLNSSGRLSAVIDFGTSGIGDPACDTTIAWTFLSGDSQRVFKERLPVDEATWTRGRGWAIWKAMIVLVRELDTSPAGAGFTKNVIDKILADHRDAR